MDEDNDDANPLSLYSPTGTVTVHRSPSSDISDPMSLEEDGDTSLAVPEASRLCDQRSEIKSAPHTMNSVSSSPPKNYQMENGLRSIKEIPDRYRSIFSEYPCFNRIQSQTVDVVYYSDEPLVVTAPTGSGKTVIFELAIIRLLMTFEKQSSSQDFKIVYMAPVKALCSEKFHEWARKFSKLKVNCLEVTGDSEISDLNFINKHQIILTTPEKWDSLTRRWRDHMSLMQTVRLFLIDEVHILNEEKRGPTLEAVVSRMKMLKLQQWNNNNNNLLPTLRFVAVSATIPNIEDLAEWLGSVEHPAKWFKVSEDMRPVTLQKVVKGYDTNFGGYQFDMHLSYKLKYVISQYSSGKPTLVFCSTRKSVLSTASTLSKLTSYSFSPSQKDLILKLSQQIVENVVKDLFQSGIGCHHAGLVTSDRNLIEDAFRSGALPVLIATSTLAMGVNLPAHLVVIKTTQFYGNGGYQDYSDSQILQMMGRAGRPQFDTSAVCVIMTKASCEEHFKRLVAGRDPIQSSLHRHLAEHLNAEVVLGTVRDLPAAVEWMRSTFLFVRALRSPQQYGLTPHSERAKINTRLQELVKVELNALARYRLVETNGVDVKKTPAGTLMARFYIAFDTMKIFQQVQGDEGLGELLVLLSKAAEFQDVQLRNDEKRALNALNCSKKGGPGLRFPIKGRIKSRDEKVNCLLQAVLGGLTIHEPSLQQEAGRVLRVADRLARCLHELVALHSGFSALLASVLLSKCLRCGLWEDSPLAGRQLPGIGPVLSQLLLAAGKTSLAAIAQSNPRDLERIINRLPPFGNGLREAAESVPSFAMDFSSGAGEDEFILTVSMKNPEVVVYDAKHWLSLLVGDDLNNILLSERFPCNKLMEGFLTRRICVQDSSAEKITAHLISEMWVGIDRKVNLALRVPSTVPAAPKGKPKGAAAKRPSFLEQLKIMGSRMNDSPSVRIPYNKEAAGGPSASERLQSFRKTAANVLPRADESGSKLGDPLGDWDLPASGDLQTQPSFSLETPSFNNLYPQTHSTTQQYQNYEAPLDEQSELDPFSDDWSGQALPNLPESNGMVAPERAEQVSRWDLPTRTPSSSVKLDYSSRIHNQPSIRNFLIPQAPARERAPQYAQSEEGGGFEDPFADVDWPDLDSVPSAHCFEPTPAHDDSRRVPTFRKPELQRYGAKSYLENITFDIGIDELIEEIMLSSQESMKTGPDFDLGIEDILKDAHDSDTRTRDSPSSDRGLSSYLSNALCDDRLSTQATVGLTSQRLENGLRSTPTVQRIPSPPLSCSGEGSHFQAIQEVRNIPGEPNDGCPSVVWLCSPTSVLDTTKVNRESPERQTECATKFQNVAAAEISAGTEASDVNVVDVISLDTSSESGDASALTRSPAIIDVAVASVAVQNAPCGEQLNASQVSVLSHSHFLAPQMEEESADSGDAIVHHSASEIIDLTTVEEGLEGAAGKPSEEADIVKQTSESECELSTAGDSQETTIVPEQPVATQRDPHHDELLPSSSNEEQAGDACHGQRVPSPAPEMRQEPEAGAVGDLITSVEAKGPEAPAARNEETTHRTRADAGGGDEVLHLESDATATKPASQDVDTHASRQQSEQEPAGASHLEIDPCPKHTKFVMALSSVPTQDNSPRPLQFRKGAPRSSCPVSQDILNVLNEAVDSRSTASSHSSGAVFGTACRRSGDGQTNGSVDKHRNFIEKILAEPFQKQSSLISLDGRSKPRAKSLRNLQIRTVDTDGILQKAESTSRRKPDFFDRLLAQPLKRLVNPMPSGVSSVLASAKSSRKSDTVCKNVSPATSCEKEKNSQSVLIQDSSKRKRSCFERSPEQRPHSVRRGSPVRSPDERVSLKSSRKQDSACNKASPATSCEKEKNVHSALNQESSKRKRSYFERSPEQRPQTVHRESLAKSPEERLSLPYFVRGNVAEAGNGSAVPCIVSSEQLLTSDSKDESNRMGVGKVSETSKPLWGGKHGMTVSRSGRYRPLGAEQPKRASKMDQLFQTILKRCETTPSEISSAEKENFHREQSPSSRRQLTPPSKISSDSHSRGRERENKLVSPEHFMLTKTSFGRESQQRPPNNYIREEYLSSHDRLRSNLSTEKDAGKWIFSDEDSGDSDAVTHSPHIFKTPTKHVSEYTPCSPSPVRSKPLNELTPLCLPSRFYDNVSSISPLCSPQKYFSENPSCFPSRYANDVEDRATGESEWSDEEEWVDWNGSPPAGSRDASFSPVTLHAPCASPFDYNRRTSHDNSPKKKYFSAAPDGFPESVCPRYSQYSANRMPIIDNVEPSNAGRNFLDHSNHGNKSKKLVLALSPSRKANVTPTTSKWDSYLAQDDPQVCHFEMKREEAGRSFSTFLEHTSSRSETFSFSLSRYTVLDNNELLFE